MNEKAQLDTLVSRCTELLVRFQRKEQLPKKFIPEDWEELSAFEAQLTAFMEGEGELGQAFLGERRTSPFALTPREGTIDTRGLKRCLKLLVKYQGE